MTNGNSDFTQFNNSNVKVVPYSGYDKPYIFISYSHRDSQMVIPVIAELQRRGYRVWYDEGITPGKEWDEMIAEHLEKCTCFIGFVSNNYLGSQNCKDELNYVRDLGKERLLVYLESVELSGGMAMRLNRLQAVHMHAYSNAEEFYKKLLSAGFLDVCKEVTQAPPYTPPTPPTPPQPRPQPTPQPADNKQNQKTKQLYSGVTFGFSIKKFFKEFKNTKGLSSRKEFLWVMLFQFIVSVITAAIAPELWAIFAIVTAWPTFTLDMRRLRDAGKNPKLVWLFLFPVYGSIVLFFICACSKSGQLKK